MKKSSNFLFLVESKNYGEVGLDDGKCQEIGSEVGSVFNQPNSNFQSAFQQLNACQFWKTIDQWIAPQYFEKLKANYPGN